MNTKRLAGKFEEWLTSFYSSSLDHASEKSEFMAKEAFYAGAMTAESAQIAQIAYLKACVKQANGIVKELGVAMHWDEEWKP